MQTSIILAVPIKILVERFQIDGNFDTEEIDVRVINLPYGWILEKTSPDGIIIGPIKPK